MADIVAVPGKNVVAPSTKDLESIDALIFRAKVADQTSRFKAMIAIMNTICKKVDRELTETERNLVSVAWKNVTTPRRASWRLVASIINAEKSKTKIDLCLTVRMRIEEELRKHCEDAIQLLEQWILPRCLSVESTVFFLKMKADHLRYIAEISPTRNPFVQQASTVYSKASDKAQELPPRHSLRLAVALNFSVFKYELQNSSDEACGIAKQAFDDAIADREENQNGKDSIMILGILRENLATWTSDAEMETS